MLFADFGEAFFPVAFVGEWIGVGAPEFFDHFALGNEGAFGLGIFVGVIEAAQGELRAGHESGFFGAGKFFVQLVRGLVQCAPAFGFGFAPKGGLGVEAAEVPEGDADLAHGLEGGAHEVAENFLERSVDDGI